MSYSQLPLSSSLMKPFLQLLPLSQIKILVINDFTNNNLSSSLPPTYNYAKSTE